MASSVPNLFVSPPIFPYPLEPGYGLFSDDRFTPHPLSVQSFGTVASVHVVQAPKSTRTKRPIFCSSHVPDPPATALVCEFRFSPTPHLIPDEVIAHLRAHKADFSKVSVKPEVTRNAVPIGFGQTVAELYEDSSFHPFSDIHLESYTVRLVPYANEVKRLAGKPLVNILPDEPMAVDYGFSFLAPGDPLFHLYANIDTEPTPRQFYEYVKTAFSDTPLVADQIALLSLAITATAMENNVGLQRAVGRNLLLIGDRVIPCDMVFSSTAVMLGFEEIHRLVATRLAIPSPARFPPVVFLEKITACRFVFDIACTHAEGDKVYALVMLEGTGMALESVLVIPSYLIPQLPAQGLVSIARLALNYRDACRSGAEGWKVETSETGALYAFPSPETAREMLRQIAAARHRRAYVP